MGALAAPLVPFQGSWAGPPPRQCSKRRVLSVSLCLSDLTTFTHLTPPGSYELCRGRHGQLAKPVGAQARARPGAGPISAGTLWGHAVLFRSEMWSVSSKVILGLEGPFSAREGQALRSREYLCTEAHEHGGKRRPSAGHARHRPVSRQLGGGSSGGKAGVQRLQPPPCSGVSSCFTCCSRARASSLAASSPFAPDTTETQWPPQHLGG